MKALPPATPESRPIGSAPTAKVQLPAAMLAAEGATEPPALVVLGQRLALSDFERETLLLCVAMELDTSIAGLCARAQGDAARPYPTFGLALTLFDHPAWEVTSPERPLRFWRLIEINQTGVQPLVASALKADERIVNYVKGLNYVDDRLTPLLTAMPPDDGASSAVAGACGRPAGCGAAAHVRRHAARAPAARRRQRGQAADRGRGGIRARSRPLSASRRCAPPAVSRPRNVHPALAAREHAAAGGAVRGRLAAGSGGVRRLCQPCIDCSRAAPASRSSTRASPGPRSDARR